MPARCMCGCATRRIDRPAAGSESYLAVERVIAVAKADARRTASIRATAFCRRMPNLPKPARRAGIVFVGPPPAAIRAMGLKDRAKALMEKAGVPVVPGYHGERQEPAFLKRKAYEIGYPVLIKAVAGGGGKGMRRVDRHADFDDALEGAQREAAVRFRRRPRADREICRRRRATSKCRSSPTSTAMSIHLYERDCSLQRRHQKVIEEAPAPGHDGRLARRAWGRPRSRRRKAVGYVGAGTVEFIADGAQGSEARRLLVHGDEHAAAGRASGHRGDHRP